MGRLRMRLRRFVHTLSVKATIFRKCLKHLLHSFLIMFDFLNQILRTSRLNWQYKSSQAFWVCDSKYFRKRSSLERGFSFTRRSFVEKLKQASQTIYVFGRVSKEAIMMKRWLWFLKNRISWDANVTLSESCILDKLTAVSQETISGSKENVLLRSRPSLLRGLFYFESRLWLLWKRFKIFEDTVLTRSWVRLLKKQISSEAVVLEAGDGFSGNGLCGSWTSSKWISLIRVLRKKILCEKLALQETNHWKKNGLDIFLC